MNFFYCFILLITINGLNAQTQTLNLLTPQNSVNYALNPHKKITCSTLGETKRGRFIILNDSTIQIKKDTIFLKDIHQIGIKTPASIAGASFLYAGGVIFGILGLGLIINDISYGINPVGIASTGISTVFFVYADRCVYVEKEINQYTYHLEIR